jgi:hypothetical protein
MMRNLGFWLSVVFLFLLGVAGLQGFLGDFHEVETLGQRIQTLGQISFGLTGIAAGTGAMMRQRWAGALALVFAVAVSLAAGFAPVVWGDAGVGSGIASAAVAFLIGIALYLGVAGGWERAKPEETTPEGDDAPPGDQG